jgi:aminoglycoside phosphotransferase (APT) family kinase protein
MSGLSAHELAVVAERLKSADAVPEGPLRADQIAGGRSNVTYRLTDGASQWVLRMPPRAGRTPSAHDVAREFRVTSGLAQTEFPVARPLVLCEDELDLGAPYIVIEYVEGVTVQSAADLGELDDATVHAITERLLATLAALHAVDHTAVGLERLGRPDGYAERQVARWSSQWELVGEWANGVAAAELARRLAGSVPPQHAASIIHGDFRIDNTILRLDGAPSIAAVVDWELSTIGDPIADVAMMCAYRHPAFDLIVGAPSAWTSDRLPTVDELVVTYEKLSGRSLSDWPFHLALAYFKVAVIAAGIEHRRRQGAGTGSGFDSSGEAVLPFLEAGLAAMGDER